VERPAGISLQRRQTGHILQLGQRRREPVPTHRHELPGFRRGGGLQQEGLLPDPHHGRLCDLPVGRK
jgi:hypothetical protein